MDKFHTSWKAEERGGGGGGGGLNVGDWGLQNQHFWVKIKTSLSGDMPTHYKNMPIQVYWNFHHQKNWKFSDKNSDNFLISAQNIDCVYSLDPPHQGGLNE